MQMVFFFKQSHHCRKYKHRLANIEMIQRVSPCGLEFFASVDKIAGSSQTGRAPVLLDTSTWPWKNRHGAPNILIRRLPWQSWLGKIDTVNQPQRFTAKGPDFEKCAFAVILTRIEQNHVLLVSSCFSLWNTKRTDRKSRNSTHHSSRSFLSIRSLRSHSIDNNQSISSNGGTNSLDGFRV